MKITTDSNVLLRFVVGDDEEQLDMATEALASASSIVIPITALCEFVWVARRVYKMKRDALVDAVETLTSGTRVKVDRHLLAAGLQMMRAGGDFADAVIASQGRAAGGDIFVTFDREAAQRVKAAGHASRYLPTEH